jgi:signal transduction histidine kinase
MDPLFRTKIPMDNGEMVTDSPEQTNVENENLGLAVKPAKHAQGLMAELRRAQQDLLKIERLSLLMQLSDRLNYELRTPLATLRVSSYVLRKGLQTSDPRVLSALERIDASVVRCDRIMDELLDFTQITEINPEPTVLDVWLAGVLAERTLSSRVALNRKFGLPATKVSFDRDRLGRAVINIIDNACQAMLGQGDEDSPARDCVLAVRTGEFDGRIEIIVADNGPGISQDVMPRIFEPLFSTRGVGVGLGLSAVEHIMEQHGGGIEIETEEGCGTRVCLWLPHGRPIR